ncbi:MAG: hypothetical protein B6241_07070 [Spirochaetaceae bacterium 4572_59]|nr:MAG: hypothetical protein B6241_07070 [Spirochaetaceae bacterium 4572_59]
MNKDLLDRNLLSLTHSSPDTANLLSYSDTSQNIKFKHSKSGHQIPCYSKDGINFKAIHSAFDPVKEGFRLSEQKHFEGMLLVFGLGGGFHIRPLLKNREITSIIIIENNPEETKSILSNLDLSDIFLDKRVSLWISDKPEDFTMYLLSRYIPVLSGNLQTLSLRSRVLQDEDFYSSLSDVVKKTIGQITDDYTVQTYFGKKWFINTLSNLKESEKTTQTLFPIKKAYITAAGPSLEKQLTLLKSKRSDETIIATDTSLPVLLANNIKPDLVISIDCQHISYNHFMSGYPEDVPLILDLASPSFLTRLAKKTFFFTSDHPFSRYVSKEFRQFPKIDTSGGNVTHAALSLADTLGAEEIKLLGADFSYPMGKPYARSTYIYPYFYSRAKRTSGIEDRIFSFIMHNKNIEKIRTDNGFRYITKPMIHYKASIEKKAQGCRGRVLGIKGEGVDLDFPKKKSFRKKEMRIVSAGKSYISCRNFLKTYRKRIADLPEMNCSVSEYLSSLTFDEKEVWITILPTAAQYRKTAETGKEALNSARSWSIDLIDRVLESDNYSNIVNDI